VGRPPLSRRLLRDPQLDPTWTALLTAHGHEVIEGTTGSPAALIAEALDLGAILLTANPDCELARCEVAGPLPSLLRVVAADEERRVGVLDVLNTARYDWGAGLAIAVTGHDRWFFSSLAMLGHAGSFEVDGRSFAWRAELHPPEESAWLQIIAVKLVLRAAPWTGSALVLPTPVDRPPTLAELVLAARVGLAHGWRPGEDLPDLPLDFYAWVGADDLHLCPCCDHRTLRSRSDYKLCPVCHWEDDGTHPLHADDYAACNDRHLRRARSTFQRFGVYSRRCPRPPDALRSCYAHEPLGDLRPLRLLPTAELAPAWSQALRSIGRIVPPPATTDLSEVERHARYHGAILVTSNPDHLAARWPHARHPSIVVVDPDPAGAGATAKRIKAHTKALRRGALLLTDRLVDLRGIEASDEVVVDGVEFWCSAELRVRDLQPDVIMRVRGPWPDVPIEGRPSDLVFDASGLFTTARNNRSRIDEPAVVRAIRAGLEAGWKQGAEGPDFEVSVPPPRSPPNA
jgi:hypothetical protein